MMQDLKLSDLSEEAYTPQMIFDQVFESGFSAEWFKLGDPKSHILPTWIHEIEWPDGVIPKVVQSYLVEADAINEATFNYFYDVIIRDNPKRKLVDWVEDLDAGEVDAILQYVCFGEIRYS